MILTQPAGNAINPGGSLTLCVTAAGSQPLTYQWRKDAINIPGANSASYTIPVAHVSDEGSYSALVMNAAGSTPSAAAQLRVTVSPFLAAPRRTDV